MRTWEQGHDDAQTTEHQAQANAPATLSQLRNSDGCPTEPLKAYHHQEQVDCAPT
jgi:hypothetical protein